jgi:energy-converting hydrogenase Eha subunit C
MYDSSWKCNSFLAESSIITGTSVIPRNYRLLCRIRGGMITVISGADQYIDIAAAAVRCEIV